MIYLDMDGVIADFDCFFKCSFGVLPSQVSSEERWQRVVEHPNYWADLPKKNDADKLVNYLREYGFTILTGVPVIGGKKAEVEKKIWLKKHYGMDKDIICCLGREKSKFCRTGDILIDDWAPNIERWIQAGGIGILHTSIENTLEQLKQLGYNL